MIDRIETEGPATPKTSPKAAHASPTGGADFAELHSKAVAADTTPNGAGKVLPGVETSLRPPKGETWGPVEGHRDYADILDGPRNGFYVNLAPGKRQGQVFVIVHKGGKTYHVYGEGKNRKAIEVHEPRKPPPGERWHKVGRHRDYRLVEGGPHDGTYINLSHNERDGRHFRIVERNGERYHVYGEGKNRIEIRVGWHERRDRHGARD
ncbi:MAG: hypothetical protein IRZ21_06205 [Thermoleophilaceae bacterium]|nr:hypothetical protein [Thermoleophilaceae bacterium]